MALGYELACSSTPFSSSGMLNQSHLAELHQTGPCSQTAESLGWQLQEGATRLWLVPVFVLVLM